MYAFSTVDYDLEGDVLINNSLRENDIHGFKRRVSRVKTLDGGVVVSDNGYVSGDRTLKLAMSNLPANEFDNIKRLAQTYSEFIVCTDEGAFNAIVTEFKVARGIVSLTFFLTDDA